MGSESAVEMSLDVLCERIAKNNCPDRALNLEGVGSVERGSVCMEVSAVHGTEVMVQISTSFGDVAALKVAAWMVNIAL